MPKLIPGSIITVMWTFLSHGKRRPKHDHDQFWVHLVAPHFSFWWAIPPVRLGTFRRKFRKISGKTPETLSERFLEFPSTVRLGCPKPYNSRHLRLREHFQNSLPLNTAGDASFFRSGSWNSQQYWGYFWFGAPPDDTPNAPSTQWNTEKPKRFFIWCAIKCRFGVASDATLYWKIMVVVVLGPSLIRSTPNIIGGGQTCNN